MKTNLFKTIGIVLIAMLAIFDFYLSIGQWDVTKATEVVETAQAEPTPSPSPSPSEDPYDYPDVLPEYEVADYSGPSRLANLGLILALQFDGTTSTYSSVKDDEIFYYDAGEILSGAYEGKKLVMAVKYDLGDLTEFFVDMGNDTYIARSPSSNLFGYKPVEGDDDSFKLSDKVTSVDGQVPVSHPTTIDLDSSTFLTLTGLPEDYQYAPVKDTQSNWQWEVMGAHYVLKARVKLETKNGFTLYTGLPNTTQSRTFDDDSVYSTEEKELNNIRNTYLKGLNDVLAVDQNGVAMLYTIGTETAKSHIDPENKDMVFMNIPSYYLYDEDISNGPANMYSTYGPGFWLPCALTADAPVVSGVTDSELSQVGTTDGAPLYKLKSSSHKLYDLAYQKLTRISKVLEGKMMLKDGTEVAMPTQESYAARTPLLFRKDYWGRLIALQEDYYMTSEGCGKPVVYLYPEKEANIRVSFLNPVSLTTQIPTYQDGWFVQASPDGHLKDLQPSATKCPAISSAFGSEYAKEACLTNSYPYIYWAGNVLSHSYVSPRAGWSVPAAEVEDFLTAKLTEVGLNATERKDMIEYWVPTLLKHGAPYYRLSFLQTHEMNQLAPLKVSPVPDTSFRIFLDWEPLSRAVSIKPQQLNNLDRKGFTLVEWGGLKR